MSEEQKQENQELEALKAEMAKKDDLLKAQQEELNKLKKIFNERQTKALDKAGILKALGIEKDPEKDPLELIKESLANTNKTIEQLKAEIKAKDEKLMLKEKQSKAEKLAQSLSFADPEDALKFIDLNSESLEDDLKKLAESKPYLLKTVKRDFGSAFNSGVKSEGTDSILEAIKKGAGLS